ncbi:MAG: LOG family protein [Phycisphaerae bacterium]|nr:LOG family protein [Phycisphaerae bacterium]
MNPPERPVVTTFGSSKPKPPDPRYSQAYELGCALGQAGYTLCNGGYGGTMEATAKGAKDAGSSTIGVTCTCFSRSGPNPYIDREIPTDDLMARLKILLDIGQAYVVLPGGSGTLVELALVWELIAKRLAPVRPIILYGHFWQPVIRITAAERPDTANLVQTAANHEEAVKLIAKALPHPA